MRAVERKPTPIPGRIELWRQAHAAGVSGRAADKIVRTRDVPRALLAQLGLNSDGEQLRDEQAA